MALPLQRSTNKVTEIDIDRLKQTFPVADMSCAACAAKVDKVLNSVPGVSRAAVNFAAATALVEYEPAQWSPAALREAVRQAGYDLIV